ncbi:glycosyltransferase family 2 protein [Mucilaginibacter sp.]
MNLPKISIITPSYNQGQFIEETILSVINQNYPNLEYIIIDGGSTDNSVDIIKKYEKHLSYWISEKDSGQTDAINKGFKLATGEIIAWINSDDLYVNNAFYNIAEFFNENLSARVVVGNGLFMNADGTVYLRKHPNISKWLEKHCMMSIFQPSTFLKRSVLTDIGYLDEAYVMMMDAEWYCRINRIFPFYVIDKDISIFRWHQASKSSSQKNSKLYHRYVEEQLLVFNASHSNYKALVNKFPMTSMYLYTKIGSSVRFIRRLLKRELFKINDVNV